MYYLTSPMDNEELERNERIARKLGKKLIGLKVEETRALGNIARNFFDYIVDTVDELIVLVEGLEHDKL